VKKKSYECFEVYVFLKEIKRREEGRKGEVLPNGPYK
jgi:hypothetical protein